VEPYRRGKDDRDPVAGAGGLFLAACSLAEARSVRQTQGHRGRASVRAAQTAAVATLHDDLPAGANLAPFGTTRIDLAAR
jgi:hypothetical protein